MTASTDKPLAWITGAAGLIGHHLANSAHDHAPAWHVRKLTRADFDLTDFGAVRKAFENDRPQLVIHCAALSQSPACQKDPALARKLNVDVTEHLAQLASDAVFVFFSTDLVFDGKQGNYRETDLVNPLSIYGKTKVAGEERVRQHPRHLIIRTSLNGGISPSGDRGFNEQLRNLFAKGQTVTLFTDEFRNPIPVPITARAVWELISGGAPGVFHIAGREKLSRWEIGQVLLKRWPELHPRLVPESLANYEGAPRPRDSSLNCEKAQARLSFRLPGLAEWLASHPNEPF